MYDAAGAHTAASHLIDPHHADPIHAAATGHVADTSPAAAPAPCAGYSPGHDASGGHEPYSRSGSCCCVADDIIDLVNHRSSIDVIAKHRGCFRAHTVGY